jgi:predicted  nucleic acid-binding Zn-ribbon protein
MVSGCDVCGCKFFLYLREDPGQETQEIEELIKTFTARTMQEMERGVREVVPEPEKSETVILDIEAIRVLSPGKYMIDVQNLFTQRPVIIRTGPGKYRLDLSTLTASAKRHEKNTG